MVGPSTFIPLSGVSKRQTSASHCTPEAEIVAADLGVRTEGLPALTLWEVLLGRSVQCVLCEDNETCIRVLETGRNPTMRHIGRTHKVDVAFLHERFIDGDICIEATESENQSADIFTKSFVLKEKWTRARDMIATTESLGEAFKAVSRGQTCVGNKPTHVFGEVRTQSRRRSFVGGLRRSGSCRCPGGRPPGSLRGRPSRLETS